MNSNLISSPAKPLIVTLVSSAVLVCVLAGPAGAVTLGGTVKTCGAGGTETLTQIRNEDTDLKVEGTCYVNGNLDNGRTSLLYVFHNVNIIGGGSLVFQDDHPIDFYAESILVEFKGSLTAVSRTTTPGYKPRLTIHLWGAPTDDGIQCVSLMAQNGAPCGIPAELWVANPGMAHNLAMANPPPATHPKNAPCKSISGYSEYLPNDDCFYQYEVQDAQDKKKGLKAYFGHKVLAVSFGGTLQLQGAKGSIFPDPTNCVTTDPANECSPANSGKSWVRLTGVSADKMTLTFNKAVDWQKDDHIVVTTTDYLPGHSEERILAGPASGNTVKLAQPLTYDHYASEFNLPPVDNSNGPTADIGPQDDPNTPDVKHAVDTRAAVGLLTRTIEIVSEGDKPNPDSKTDTFPPTPGNYYGGHTIVRQGFAGYQVQGVRFYRLGQGGAKGRYAVHFAVNFGAIT